MLTSQGYKYEGLWKKGRISGSGAITFPDGTRFVRVWDPPSTLHLLVSRLQKEQAAQQQEKIAEKHELYRILNKTKLSRYVAAVRQQIQKEKDAERHARLEERDRLNRERREQIRKAKEDAMRAAAGEDKNQEKDVNTAADDAAVNHEGKSQNDTAEL